MNIENKDKVLRVLSIYEKLMEGSIVNKEEEANYYKVTERSIQRDIDDIRSFMDQETIRTGVINSVIYDRSQKGYRLEQINKMQLSNGELLAICKILLDSRAFTKNEMINILDRLIESCVPKENKALIKKLIKNEEFHYVELSHQSVFIEKCGK